MSHTDLEELVGIASGWIREKAADRHGPDVAITPETDLLSAGVLDSLGFIELVAFLEETTGRQIDLTDIEPEQFTTVVGLCSHAVRENGQRASTGSHG